MICDSATIVHELQRKLGLQECVKQAAPTSVPATDSGCCKGTSCCKEDNVNQTIWILADTSYSACCVDEVAAEHVNSDLVVHFGDACLNPIDKLPVVYVFGKPYLDNSKVIESFKLQYTDRSAKILMMSDTCNISSLVTIFKDLSPEYENLRIADVSGNASGNIIGYAPMETTAPLVVALNRKLVGVESADELNEYDLFHVTIPEAPRLLQLTTKFQSVSTYDTKTEKINNGSHPNLMRRYRYVHMARSAGTIGLLVNTLSLANTKTLINNIAEKVKEAGKKHYIFVVGKPNVAKLANFENVDLWCILGCDHQGIIVDQNNEYFKPIVTPYELLLALSDELSWSGQWVTDFNEVLKNLKNEEEAEEETEKGIEENNNDSDSDEAPEFDPVTGKYVSTSRPLRRLQHLQVTSGPAEQDEEKQENALIKKFSTTIAIKNTVSTSAIHLQNRSWTGLGSDYQDDGDNEGATLENGTGGIARGYDYDIENRK